jgi:signal transduction histidine kinase
MVTLVLVVVNTVIAVAAVVFGLLVLRNEPKNVAYQSFFIFASGIALSAAAKPFFQEDKNFLVFLLVWWGFEIMVLGVFSLACVSSDGTLNGKCIWSLVPWFILFVSIPVLLVAASFRADPDSFFWAAYHDIFPLFAVFMVVHLAISFFSCVRHRVSTFGLPFHLVASLMLVVMLSASIICIADLILPAFGVYRFSTLSNASALIILMVGGCGIARYGAGNGSAVLRRGIPYFLSLVFVAAIFFAVEFAIEKFFYQNDEVVDIVAAVAGALAFPWLRNFFNRITDRIFFRNSYRFFTAAQTLGEQLDGPLDRNTLLARADEFLHWTIQPTETVFFSVNDGGKPATLVFGLTAKAARTSDYGSLVALFLERAHGRTIIADAARLFGTIRATEKKSDSALIKEQAVRLGVAAIVPIMIQGKTEMVMMVGYKCSGALLGTDDVELLDFVGRRVAVTLENLELREMIERQAQKFEERVMARTEQLKSMYESQSRFLADVSHEFKTPLAILKMNAGIFAASEDAEQKKAWYVMDTTLDRLSRMVSNILDVNRTCSLRGGLCKKRISVEDLLRETHDDCVILVEDKGVTLRFVSDQMVILGERDRLKEVMLNLVSNALRHTAAGGSITLAARVSHGEAEIAVRDTGSGISRDNLPHIFERFYRIEGSGLAGTGIGLYLCRQIIEGHGGTITAESDFGKGTCFVVRLPLYTGDP